MTKEAGYVALKEESEARSVISQLGLNRELRGTHIIQEFVIGKRKTENLSNLEVEMVLSAWETRHYVPRKLIMAGEKVQLMVDNLNFSEENEENAEKFNRNKVKLIERYDKTIRA